ncbi:ATP-grasp domain-containing protein [Actinomadura kijaniata]|uniref:ATP-grasp domain-containing protein n=1 Tax=Actinomadura kijaniata TaxID=46161 RepID=UPI000832355B|nr:siderophore biosynthesis protein [Actinomadura kijaniata]
MAASLYIVAGRTTDSVTHGLLPAAAVLGRERGLETVLLTDRPAEHAKVWDGRVVACDVTDYREIIAAAGSRPAAVLTDSDRLQAPVALAAAYLDLPAKDWRAATRTRNRALLRRHLAGLDPVFCADAWRVPPDAPYPLVLRPREGGGDAFRVRDAGELAARREELNSRRGGALVVEEHLPGETYTLEPLGDGRELRVLGAFHARVAPPRFVVERLDWTPPPEGADQVLAQLEALGVGLGACHTEFVVHEGRARIVRIAHRLIGDRDGLLLADLLGVPLFEQVVRVHLGERLPDPPPRTDRHAVADAVLTERSGVLVAAPDRTEQETSGVRISYRPRRVVGDRVDAGRADRDRLGTVRATGPSRAAVEAAVAAFRAAHTWKIA